MTTPTSTVDQKQELTRPPVESLHTCVEKTLTSDLLLCSPVVCPFPNTQPEDNHSLAVPLVSVGGNGTAFGDWWSKTNTVPLYLIVLLLPLLCFRSASFFARFSFLGEFAASPPVCCLTAQPRGAAGGAVRLQGLLVFIATSPRDDLKSVAEDDSLLLLYNSLIMRCGERDTRVCVV